MNGIATIQHLSAMKVALILYKMNLCSNHRYNKKTRLVCELSHDQAKAVIKTTTYYSSETDVTVSSAELAYTRKVCAFMSVYFQNTAPNVYYETWQISS